MRNGSDNGGAVKEQLDIEVTSVQQRLAESLRSQSDSQLDAQRIQQLTQTVERLRTQMSELTQQHADELLRNEEELQKLRQELVRASEQV